MKAQHDSHLHSRLKALPGHAAGCPACEDSSMDGPCMDCGTMYIPWFTSHSTWNGVLNGDLQNHFEAGGLLCVNCFLLRADTLTEKRIPAFEIGFDQLEHEIRFG